jgi:hypothetical protein
MYVVTKGSRLFIGGREILPSDIHIVCSQEQIDVLLKNKTIKKKKGESDEKTRNNSSID